MTVNIHIMDAKLPMESAILHMWVTNHDDSDASVVIEYWVQLGVT